MMHRLASFALAWVFTAPVSADQAYFHGIIGEKTGFSIQIDPQTPGASGTVIYESSGEDGLSVSVSHRSRVEGVVIFPGGRSNPGYWPLRGNPVGGWQNGAGGLDRRGRP